MKTQYVLVCVKRRGRPGTCAGGTKNFFKCVLAIACRQILKMQYQKIEYQLVKHKENESCFSDEVIS